MASNSNGGGLIEAQVQIPSNETPDGYKANDDLRISLSPKALLSDESPVVGFRERFSGILVQKVNWATLRKICKEWIKCPLNMVLLLWIICVAISGAILFLVMTGMLNRALPKKSQRNSWFEINNQILNALFTLMCLYQHPKRFHHLILLCRWKPKDVTTLRKVYCKNGTYKPREWFHMMVVVVLLHVNCFAQYALCGLNLGYKRSERPAIGVGMCLSIAIAAPAIAGVYSIVSPLGKDYDSEVDPEAPDQILINGNNRRLSSEKRFSFASRNPNTSIEYPPLWKGGLFDLWDNIVVAYLSLFFTFCVFGWNMERLGFGNMYVHIATFLLICSAPFWIFNLAAVNIDNETVREVLVSTGVILCVFGLLYGGYWRIQMRKRFNLPPNNSCCGSPAIADCAQWLFCCWCSLAQEVRTADYYDMVEDKFCKKKTDGNSQPTLTPLPREEGSVPFRSRPTSLLWNNSGLSTLETEKSPSSSTKDQFNPDKWLPEAKEEYSSRDADDYMKPPVWPSIQRE
ncbi:hypothetical protein Ddye_014965 [Dipteronia dyeriana]|uniref:PLAC8 motif-containing protein n=1 Tax=Dipteronia dyeriana TaxID=168575 RepID=A0AAD9WY21_9ROSI|nr:hypothetical protein Ddye_014965 [Dipteronia dyeriana]